MMADINQTGMCEGVQDRREGGVDCFHSCACVCVLTCDDEALVVVQGFREEA